MDSLRLWRDEPSAGRSWRAEAAPEVTVDQAEGHVVGLAEGSGSAVRIPIYCTAEF
jgi:hypothetical protein